MSALLVDCSTLVTPYYDATDAAHRSMAFHWPGCVQSGCVRPARAPSPDRQPWQRGPMAVARSLAAARGCRSLRRFFFLLTTRNVIRAGPRQGQASLRSVRQRTLDMAFSARIEEAQEGGRKTTNAAATGRFRG